jgi:uncharacterized protein DUF4340
MAGMIDFLRTASPFRNLVLLACVTLFFCVAAAIALSTQRENTAIQFEPELFFPGLADKVNQATKLVYTTGLGMQGTANITLERGDDGIWRVGEREGYPAKGDKVRRTILGLTELEAFEPRTRNPEWHRNLGLLEPEKLGSAVRVQLFAADGTELASMLTGEVVESTTDIQGRGFVYVRRDGEDQTWLARGSVSLDKVVANWLVDDVVSIPLSDTRRVTLWAGTEKPAILSRTSPDHANFIVENVPDGAVTRGAPIVNASATAFSSFVFEDAVPVTSLLFPDPPVAVIETFDGLKLTIIMTGAGSAMWAKFLAEADYEALGEETDEAARAALDAKVADINARVGEWAYKLEQNLGLRLTQTMDQLTRPVTAETP